MAKDDQDIEVTFEELAKDRFIAGDPDEVAAEILRYNEELGVTHMDMSVQDTGMPQTQTLETFRLITEEVFPKVRAAME